MEAARPAEYLLRNDSQELRRLERQGAMLAQPSRILLEQAGIGAGMRVLNLGTGIGELAFLAAKLVGPEGEVLGVDQSAGALQVAAQRARARGLRNVAFEQGDVATWEPPAEFDAVIGRLVLIYLQHPAAVIRRHLAALRPGGVYLALEYDMAVMRAVPAVPLATRAVEWCRGAFQAAHIDIALGTRLGSILSEAGMPSPSVLGIQPVLAPSDVLGPANLAGIVRSLAPVIERAGIAGGEEMRLDTLEQRLAAEMVQHGAVLMPPTLVGGWARHGATH